MVNGWTWIRPFSFSLTWTLDIPCWILDIRLLSTDSLSVPSAPFPDVPDFLIHFSFKVLGFELNEEGIDPDSDLDGSKPQSPAGGEILNLEGEYPTFKSKEQGGRGRGEWVDLDTPILISRSLGHWIFLVGYWIFDCFPRTVCLSPGLVPRAPGLLAHAHGATRAIGTRVISASAQIRPSQDIPACR